jgi:hypothetical protein
MSPLHCPTQDSYGEHATSAAQADDSPQQFADAQDAHRVVP